MDVLRELDADWTLFLDRDGVINHEKEADYIKQVDEFIFYEGVLEALQILSVRFKYLFIVTNQRGIGKGLMTHEDLHAIHATMKAQVLKAGGRIDAIYYAPELASDAINRKPNIGMGLQAKNDFPAIDFHKSLMVGNNLSDMEFGKNLKMKTVFLSTTNPNQAPHPFIDLIYPTLLDFAKNIL
ncbi:MAG: HAD-IIIA family hydrolase [Bacteroidetes bacterium]|nr:HAD-IIIA family hydrolase [Bacteroidota bacterium]